MIGYYHPVDTEQDHFVVWSGGCDSTLLLYEVASKYGTKEKPIKTISIENQFLLKDKKKAERRQRGEILEEFKRRGLHIENTIVKTTDKGHKYPPRQDGLPQAFLWIAQSMIYVGNANFYFGYIRTDDFWHYDDKFLNAIDAMGSVLNKSPQVQMPLQVCRKSDVIRELHKLDLYDLTWYCEKPTSPVKQCYNCEPCKTHMTALFELASSGEEWATKKLEAMTKAKEELDKDRELVITC